MNNYPWNKQFRKWADEINVCPCGGGYVRDTGDATVGELAEGLNVRHAVTPFVLFAVREVLLLDDEDDCLELAREWMEWAPGLYDEQAELLDGYAHRLVAPAGNRALTLAAYLISIYHYFQNIWSEMEEGE